MKSENICAGNEIGKARSWRPDRTTRLLPIEFFVLQGAYNLIIENKIKQEFLGTFLGQIHMDVLGMGELQQAVEPQFSAHTGLLVVAERRQGIEQVVDRAGAQPFGQRDGMGHVPGKYGAAQTLNAVVGHAHGVDDALIFDHREHWPENFLAGNGHGIGTPSKIVGSMKKPLSKYLGHRPSMVPWAPFYFADSLLSG